MDSVGVGFLRYGTGVAREGGATFIVRNTPEYEDLHGTEMQL